MKRLIAIAAMSFLLHAAIAHALADCFDVAGGTHKFAMGGSPDAFNSEHNTSPSIHCADWERQFGLFLRSSADNVFRHLGKFLHFTEFDLRDLTDTDQALPLKTFYLALNSLQFHAAIYIAVSVLRI